jgi:hypothetical protein
MGAHTFRAGALAFFWACIARNDWRMLATLMLFYSVNGVLILFAGYSFLGATAFFQLNLGVASL